MKEEVAVSSTEYLLVKHKYYSTVIADILKAIQGGSFGGAFILSFCCIDYLCINNNAKSTKLLFQNVVRDYLEKINSKYAGQEEKLYAMRCSLVHTHGESNATNKLNFIPRYLYNILPPDDHLDYNKVRNIFSVSLSTFVSEVILATELFFYRYKYSLEELKVWGNKIYFSLGLIELTQREFIKKNEILLHQSIHPYLSVLDTEKNINDKLTDIKRRIEKEMKKHL